MGILSVAGKDVLHTEFSSPYVNVAVGTQVYIPALGSLLTTNVCFYQGRFFRLAAKDQV